MKTRSSVSADEPVAQTCVGEKVSNFATALIACVCLDYPQKFIAVLKSCFPAAVQAVDVKTLCHEGESAYIKQSKKNSRIMNRSRRRIIYQYIYFGS